MEGAVNEEPAQKPKSMAEVFDESFPIYLSMGMTYGQFWKQDVSLVIPYRKAHKMRLEQQNHYAWLQGMYIYEALCDVSPVLHAFAKSGTTVRPYPEKPYELFPKKKKVERNEDKMQNAISFMERMTAQFNMNFAKRKALEEAAGKESEDNG